MTYDHAWQVYKDAELYINTMHAGLGAACPGFSNRDKIDYATHCAAVDLLGNESLGVSFLKLVRLYLKASEPLKFVAPFDYKAAYHDKKNRLKYATKDNAKLRAALVEVKRQILAMQDCDGELSDEHEYMLEEVERGLGERWV